MSNTQPYDILSEDFADFALDEVEEFEDLSDRTEVDVQANGQTFRAKVLGFGSSYKEDDHSHAPGMLPPREGCPSCRWADIAIMRMDSGEGPSSYVLATMGKSEVAGETHRLKIVFTSNPRKVLQGVFVNTKGPKSGPMDKKIPVPNAVAFRRAAAVDEELETVLRENEALVPDPAPEGTYQGF